MYDIPCVIFAGGKSTRMGEDKALLPFDDFNTLTEFQLSKLSKIFKHVYISCRDKKKFNFDANFIEDLSENEIYAPTLGFISSFTQLNTSSIFVISVDAPFITKKEIDKIILQDKQNNDVTIAKTPLTLHPMIGIYHNSMQKEFLNMLQTNAHKLNYLLQHVNTTYVNFQDEKPFLNLNKPQDYQQALKLI